MGRKDIGLKSYLQDKERYADLWNGSVFQGRQIIKAEELQEITPVHSKSYGDNALERIGDLVMRQNYAGHCFAVLALENQQETDYGMPVRIMLQEALEYDKQLQEVRRENERKQKIFSSKEETESQDAVYRDSGEYLYKIKREDHLFPVITLVVYWGEKGWKGAKSLHDMIGFHDKETAMGKELRKLVPEYPLHLLDLTSFSHTEYFRTELRPLFEMFQRRGSKKEFVKYVEENEGHWNMNDESWHMLSQLTDSRDLKYLISQKNKKEGKDKVMCKAIEDLKNDAKAEGKAEFIVELLEEYGEVPDRLKEILFNQKDMSVLNDWFRLAMHVKSVDEFMRQISATDFCHRFLKQTASGKND